MLNKGYLTAKKDVDIKICCKLRDVGILRLSGHSNDWVFFQILDRGWYAIFSTDEEDLKTSNLSEKELEKLNKVIRKDEIPKFKDSSDYKFLI